MSIFIYWCIWCINISVKVKYLNITTTHFSVLDYVPCIKAPYSVLSHYKLNRAQLAE